MSPLDAKLVERFNAAIDAEDAKAIDTMASGTLRDIGEYRFSAGYRKALRDAKKLLSEAYEDLMKE